jgi:hypothetical protein
MVHLLAHPAARAGQHTAQLSTPNASLRRCFDKLDQAVKAWVEGAKLAAYELDSFTTSSLLQNL